MNKKLFVIPAIVCAMIFTGYQAYESIQEPSSNLTLANVVALADDEDGDLWKGYKNIPKECTITEEYECTFDLIIPEYVPYIGGTECKLGFTYSLDFDGMHNPCDYTGNPHNLCDYYPCTKNGEK